MRTLLKWIFIVVAGVCAFMFGMIVETLHVNVTVVLIVSGTIGAIFGALIVFGFAKAGQDTYGPMFRSYQDNED